MVEDVLGVLGVGDGPAVAQAEDVGVDPARRVGQGLDLRRRLLEGDGRLRADRARGGQAHVGHEDVGARPGHVSGLLLVEDVRRGDEIELVGHADHVDLVAVAHAGLLEIRAEDPVDEADGREVLHAGEADLLDLPEEVGHDPERIGAVDAGQHRGALDHGQDLVGHLHDDGIGVAVGEQPGQGAATGHAEAPRVVDDEQVDAAGLGGLRGDAGARTTADDGPALGDLTTETIQDLVT